MYGKVVGGSLKQPEIFYYLYEDDNGLLYIIRNKTFSYEKRRISHGYVREYTIEFTETTYDENGQENTEYLIGLVFDDRTTALIQCDSEAAKKIIIAVY